MRFSDLPPDVQATILRLRLEPETRSGKKPLTPEEYKARRREYARRYRERQGDRLRAKNREQLRRRRAAKKSTPEAP